MRIIEQDFIIDRLTDSILNTISGDSFQTEISILTKNDTPINRTLSCLQDSAMSSTSWRIEPHPTPDARRGFIYALIGGDCCFE